jgi:hypothetical protein
MAVCRTDFALIEPVGVDHGMRDRKVCGALVMVANDHV